MATTAPTFRHPLYAEWSEDWEVMRDCYAGDRTVKEGGFKYLPATSGMAADGLDNMNSPGYRAYSAYRKRARFPEVVEEAVQAMIGVMHHKPPTIELPTALEPMLESATSYGESLEILLRRINEEQLITGRVGMLLDMPAEPTLGSTLPYIALYSAESVLNWEEDEVDSSQLLMVVLDESKYEREKLTWRKVNQYRVLLLGTDLNKMNSRIYSSGLYKDTPDNVSSETLVQPMYRGKTLKEIPFIVINSRDVVVRPDKPPLLRLANLALSIYRGDADYRQSLFMQGQDTLVIIGAADEDEVRTGANASIKLTIGGDAKYIGVNSGGLAEQRASHQYDLDLAAQQGGQLLDSVSRERESGEALRIRVAARTATLNQLALAGAFGLERLLKTEARWVGANPEEVRVIPNLDFVDDTLSGQELAQYMVAKVSGSPHSLKSIHKLMQDKGLTELSYTEEMKELEGEPPIGGATLSEGEPGGN